MRIGINPAKENNELKPDNYHRVVIPVYIPSLEEDYFKDSLHIFKICLESLLLTAHKKTRITIYNNNCCNEVKKYIDEKYQEVEAIDQVIHSKYNVGKINAILASVKGNIEPLITITDADVFFKNGWQEACERVFIGFPEAGMVSPVPNPRLFNTSNSNNWYYGVFKGKLRFEKVYDSQAIIKFYNSIGIKKSELKPIHLDQNLVLYNKDRSEKAIMGCGHFVATLRREVFDKGSSDPAFLKIVGGVEGKFIDIPNEDLGYLRLATVGNFAYHLGNKVEFWMNNEFNLLSKNNNDPSNLIIQQAVGKKSLIGRFLSNLIRVKTMKKLILYSFGLRRDYIIY